MSESGVPDGFIYIIITEVTYLRRTENETGSRTQKGRNNNMMPCEIKEYADTHDLIQTVIMNIETGRLHQEIVCVNMCTGVLDLFLTLKPH